MSIAIQEANAFQNILGNLLVQLKQNPLEFQLDDQIEFGEDGDNPNLIAYINSKGRKEVFYEFNGINWLRLKQDDGIEFNLFTQNVMESVILKITPYKPR